MKRRLVPLSARGAYNHRNGPYQNIWCLQYFPLIQRRQRNRHTSSIIADPKNPTRWVPAYIVRETEGKANDDITEMDATIEGRIKEKCHGRGDYWAEGRS